MADGDDAETDPETRGHRFMKRVLEHVLARLEVHLTDLAVHVTGAPGDGADDGPAELVLRIPRLLLGDEAAPPDPPAAAPAPAIAPRPLKSLKFIAGEGPDRCSFALDIIEAGAQKRVLQSNRDGTVRWSTTSRAAEEGPGAPTPSDLVRRRRAAAAHHRRAARSSAAESARSWADTATVGLSWHRTRPAVPQGEIEPVGPEAANGAGDAIDLKWLEGLASESEEIDFRRLEDALQRVQQYASARSKYEKLYADGGGSRGGPSRRCVVRQRALGRVLRLSRRAGATAVVERCSAAVPSRAAGRRREIEHRPARYGGHGRGAAPHAPVRSVRHLG